MLLKKISSGAFLVSGPAPPLRFETRAAEAIWREGWRMELEGAIDDGAGGGDR